jgi:hypothetical protein
MLAGLQQCYTAIVAWGGAVLNATGAGIVEVGKKILGM